MLPGRTAALALLLLTSGMVSLTQAAAAEPSVGFNGWTNVPGVVEGTINVHPVNTTLPKPALGYVDYLPKGYNPSDTSTRWPVVFALLGAAQQGDGTDTVANGHQLRAKMTSNGPLFDVDSQQWDFPCIVISPQAAGPWSNPTTIKSMVDYVKANYRVDTSRMYMTGLADGSAGTLRFAIANPGVLAGIIPVEPTYGPTTSAETDALKRLPMWMAQCFSDQALNHRNAVAWFNQVTQADTGLTSDLTAAYPGYGANINHYACDTAATGLPLSPAGPSATVASAALTSGSATVTLPAGNLIANAGSFFVGMWGGSDAAPFVLATFGADPTTYVVKSVSATTIVLTHPYTGATQTADAHIITPNGLVVSAYYQSATGTWTWPKTSAQTPPPAGSPDNRVFTMFWQYDNTNGWINTYLNGQVWDWLFSRAPVTTTATLALGGLTTTFTGGAQAATVTTSPTNLAVNVTYNGAATLPVNAGAYLVTATVSDPVYTGSTSGTMIIAPAALGITLSGLSATYDGSPKPATITTAPAGVAITTTYSGGAVPVEPGSYAVSVASANANFTGSAAGSLVIAKATATIALGQLAATFDGTAKTVTTSTVPPGLAVTVSYNGSLTAPSAAGTYAVTATVTDTHYQGVATGSLNIAGASVLTVAEHGDHQVIQRLIGTTSGTVQFSGTFSGPRPDHLDARVVAIGGGVAVDWTTIAAGPSGSTWNGALAVPQGGWYQVQVRSLDAGGTVLTSTVSTVPWGVGINILCIGQSNMAGFGDLLFTTADDRVGQVRSGTTWQHLVDPWITNLKASCGPALGNTLVAALDIPIGLVPAATLDTTMLGNGNTDLSFRNSANHADPATTYGRALRATSTAGAVEFVCVSQGAAEAALNTVGTADYVAAFAQMEAHFHEDLPQGAQVRFVLSQLGRRVTTPAADAGYDAIREAHRLLDDGATTLLAGSTMDFPLADGFTHYGQAGQDPHGRRFARTILFALGQRAVYGGPRVAAARFSDATRRVVQVTIAQRGGSDFQPATTIPGFAVRDATGPKVVTAARGAGSLIALTCTTPCSGATTITYLEGMNPAGPLGLFKDDQPDPEPLLPITVPLAVQDPPITAATVTLGNLNATYDGAAHAATVTTSPAGLATTITYDGGSAAPVNAGAHAVVATIVDASHTGSASGTLTIAPAPATVTLSGLSATYDGAAHAATVTTTPAGLATTVTYDGAAAAPVATGAHAVVATVADPNYTGSANGTLNITTLAEPTVGFNGWTNVPGVVEGTITTFPVNTTLPTPPLGFVAYFPKGYNQADTTTKWPVVMYLVGIGDTGDGTDTTANGHQLYAHMTARGPLYQVAAFSWDFPAIIIAPQTQVNWNSTNSIKAEMDYAKAHFRVDPKHVYLTGYSDGASGVLRYAAAYPTDPAAILPIEAGANPGTGQADALKSIPMWAAHCFADPGNTARTVSIAWVDGTTTADTGLASDCMANYPGYGTTPRNHYACDADPLTGFPALPNGPVTTFGAATVTSASKYVAFNATIGSSIYLMWSASTDAQPFARFSVPGANAATYPMATVYPTGFYATKPYVGATATLPIAVVTPIGYNVTGSYALATGWSWARDQHLDAGKPGKHIFTMFWYDDHEQGWRDTWGNPEVWNWLFSQTHP